MKLEVVVMVMIEVVMMVMIEVVFVMVNVTIGD
jgi:hypothetical protein